MVIPLAVGFAMSATIVFYLLWLIGKVTAHYPVSAVLPFALSLMALIDFSYPRFVIPSIRRQTPRQLLGSYRPRVAGLVWGLDAGLVVTTFRSSAASWAGAALMLAGWGQWWSGLAYAAGFALPLLVIVLARGEAVPDAAGVTRRLLGGTRPMHYVAGTAIAAAAVTSAFT